jgi:hypothetical protein
VRHRSPARQKDSLLPLRQNIEPGIEVKFNVVAGRRSEKEEGNLDRESRATDRQQSSPAQR